MEASIKESRIYIIWVLEGEKYKNGKKYIWKISGWEFPEGSETWILSLESIPNPIRINKNKSNSRHT